jgi:hypothetical protein
MYILYKKKFIITYLRYALLFVINNSRIEQKYKFKQEEGLNINK